MKVLCVVLALCVLSSGVACKLASAAQVTSTVSLTIEINGTVQSGKITIGLFGNDVPRTAENFRRICAGKERSSSGVSLNFNSCPFHRIIPSFMIQCGDFTNKNGTGGLSVYGNKFDDENFDIDHDIGVLSMANSGPNTNGSQFFITTAQTSWLNGKHTVFGRIVDGMDLVKKIESYGSGSGKPTASVNIATCVEDTPKSDL